MEEEEEEEEDPHTRQQLAPSQQRNQTQHPNSHWTPPEQSPNDPRALWECAGVLGFAYYRGLGILTVRGRAWCAWRVRCASRHLRFMKIFCTFDPVEI